MNINNKEVISKIEISRYKDLMDKSVKANFRLKIQKNIIVISEKLRTFQNRKIYFDFDLDENEDYFGEMTMYGLKDQRLEYYVIIDDEQNMRKI